MKSESPRNQLVIAPSRHVRSCDRTEIVTLIALLLSPRKGHLAEAGQTEGGAFFQIHRLYAGPFPRGLSSLCRTKYQASPYA